MPDQIERERERKGGTTEPLLAVHFARVNSPFALEFDLISLRTRSKRSNDIGR